MGRRVLRKIDDSIDLSHHLRTIDELPLPFHAPHWFGRDAPLEIEIGSGKGLFICSASQRHPERDFVGIEIARKYARFSATKLARAERLNALMIHGDARQLLQRLFSNACAAAIHVYFPDPWWKKRHQKRRIMNEQMLRQMERLLQSGGWLHFWTDVQEYFEATLALISRSTNLSGPVAIRPRQPEHDLDYQTHFERRMRLHGDQVYRAKFRND